MRDSLQVTIHRVTTNSKIRKLLQTLSRKICDLEAQPKRESFVLFGGPSVLSSVLYKDPLPRPPTDGRQLTNFLNIQNEICAILRELCLSVTFHSNALPINRYLQ
jgi:hypothetical protein